MIIRNGNVRCVRLGAHALIWAPGWSTADAERVICGAAAAGFDFVEIALMRPEEVDVAATRALLSQYGLGCTCGLGLPASCHLPFAPTRAEAHLDLGSPFLTGGIYTNLGTRTGNPPTPEELATVAAVLKRVARRAADAGVTLGVENINRYETYLVNRMRDRRPSGVRPVQPRLVRRHARPLPAPAVGSLTVVSYPASGRP
jgi:D-psicose/D-tagatose/L-ribulose 3-epimerase